MEPGPDGIYFKDAQSHFLRVNRAVANRFGLKDPSEAVGKADGDFFQGESAEALIADEREVIRSGATVIAKEEREVWADGSVTWASTSTVPMRDAAGNVIGVLGISRDTTARHHEQQELQHSKQRLERLVAE